MFITELGPGIIDQYEEVISQSKKAWTQEADLGALNLNSSTLTKLLNISEYQTHHLLFKSIYIHEIYRLILSICELEYM